MFSRKIIFLNYGVLRKALCIQDQFEFMAAHLISNVTNRQMNIMILLTVQFFSALF